MQPKNTIRFSVSDETIATIDSKTGMLTSVSDGDVTVIVTALDGSGIIGEIVVTINNEIVQVSAITVIE